MGGQDKQDEKNEQPILKLRHSLKGKDLAIRNVLWSPDGRILALGSFKQVWLWDIQTKQVLHTIANTSPIYSMAWSPNGDMLVAGSYGEIICLWDRIYQSKPYSLFPHSGEILSIAWSPDGKVLASGSDDKVIRLWDVEQKKLFSVLVGHEYAVRSIAWSPDGTTLASGSYDETIRLWRIYTGVMIRLQATHSHKIYCVAWSPNGRFLASGSNDRTIGLWDIEKRQQIYSLEGHTSAVNYVAFSRDFMASKSLDNTVRLWNCNTWSIVEKLKEPVVNYATNLSFHPKMPILATLGENDSLIRIWELNVNAGLVAHPKTPTVHYTNAKVVLVGDSGVGKSGLALVLTGEPYARTDSSHSRHVWTFDIQEVSLEGEAKETRETLLWDLAGQPGYRLIHQLHLNEVAVALVIFDTHSETDPFAGVLHWDRALRQAQRVQGNSALDMKKFLVAARTDRGGIGVSQERIDTLIRELGFDGYFVTSAREGWNIAELREAIRGAINWSILPRVSSTVLFQHIKDFLVAEKKAEHLLSTVEDLYRTFVSTTHVPTDVPDLYAQFETCIGRVESRDLIKKLSFGNLILLQPELLDAYASALVNAVKDEPEGLGSIDEERVRVGNFPMSADERITNKEQEKLLLIAMVEDLLRREIALRDGPFLIFPSQSTRLNPDLPDPEGKCVIFDFEGPVQNIYATLAVRLSQSGFFKKKELWKDAITYEANTGGLCGVFLRNKGDGKGELTIFVDTHKPVSKETLRYFEEYIQTHLQRRVIEGSIKRRRVVMCSKCGWIVTEQTIQLLAKHNLKMSKCFVCNQKILLPTQEEKLSASPSAFVLQMDSIADGEREREVFKSTIQGRRQVGDFDVFLCHNNIDKSQVMHIGELLIEQGIVPWLDAWELQPGLPWQPLLEKQIGQIKSAAVFIGQGGVGPWQDQELRAFLQQFTKRECPVIPVILPSCEYDQVLPLFLQNMTNVDFRREDPDPLVQLIWGITGNRP